MLITLAVSELSIAINIEERIKELNEIRIIKTLHIYKYKTKHSAERFQSIGK